LTADVAAAALRIVGLRGVKVTNGGGAASNTIDLKVIERGDINGNRSVNIGDALSCALTVGLINKPVLPASVGDLNLNGSVNIGDCLALALFTGRINVNFATPTITAVSPLAAVVGAPLTITGSGLAPGTITTSTLVSFTIAGNGVVRVSPSAASFSSLTVTVPSNAISGPLQVYRLDAPVGSAEFPLDVSSSGTMLALTAVSPSVGVVPGQSITVSGMGFDAIAAGNTLLFRTATGAAAGTVTAASTSSLTVTVPSGAVCGPVTVTVGGQTSNARIVTVAGTSCGVQLTDLWGGGAPGQTLVLEGAGFDVVAPANNIVRFTDSGGGTVIAPVLAAGGTQLHVTIPQTAVQGNVTVTVGAATSNPLSYTP